MKISKLTILGTVAVMLAACSENAPAPVPAPETQKVVEPGEQAPLADAGQKISVVCMPMVLKIQLVSMQSVVVVWLR